MPSCDQNDCACTIYVDPFTGKEISDEELKKIRKSRKYLEHQRKIIEKEKKEKKAREIEELTAKLEKIKTRLAELEKED